MSRANVTFRISRDLHADLVAAARKNGRSLNAEMERRLLKSVAVEQAKIPVSEHEVPIDYRSVWVTNGIGQTWEVRR